MQVPAPGPVPAPTTTNETNIYLIKDKNPFTVQSNQTLTCTSSSGKCTSTQLAKNIAISFTINLQTPNATNAPQQIIGMNANINDPNSRILTAWICPNSNNLYIQRSTTINVDGNIMNCRAPIDIGQNNTFYIICNSTTGMYQIYKNGSLYDTQYSSEAPLYTSGQANIATSFNNLPTFNGSLSNIVLLTSNSRMLQSNDLDATIHYMNSN